MPAQRPRASFEPIPPYIDMEALVENTPNFEFVDRITVDMIDKQGLEKFDKLVREYVILQGKPLVIEGYQTRMDPWTFSAKWLEDNHGDKAENARNLTEQEDIRVTIGHYLRNMRALTNQFFDAKRPDNYREKKRQRVYLKDIDAPEVWVDKLQDILPESLFYLNESTGAVGGPGSAKDDPRFGATSRKGKGIAPSGDLMSSLEPQMRAENMMCYIGHEGTYTPAHREMCASLGQNLMVEASEAVGDTGIPERRGSSVWFMTGSNDRQLVAEYWLSKLGHDIEVEKHFAQIAAWTRAPFQVYVVEQRPGDLILIPPLAPHQVWNRGTRTMKIAWNRTTVETLELAMKEALPNARQVCRDEQYKNKAIIFYTLSKYSQLLEKVQDLKQTAPTREEFELLTKDHKIRQLAKDFKRLFDLFKDILLSEMFAPGSNVKGIEYLPYDSNVTCAYCRGNIFNRFLTCKSCDMALQTPEPEPYDVCMECYAMGRSCGCVSHQKWVEQFKWAKLVEEYERFRRQYLALEKGISMDSPQTIQNERAKLVTKKTLAQVCQEQLKLRPFSDPNKTQDQDRNKDDELDSEDGNEVQIDEDGTVKKAKKRRSEAWLKNHHACHVCCHRHEKWKMATCKCNRSWCYGVLFRGFDLMPQQVMENSQWECPHCLGICSAGACRKLPTQTPYQPKGTVLGHDTKRVADLRSVESLVDFGVSNLNWLKESADVPSGNARLVHLQHDAAQRADAAAQTDDDDSDDGFRVQEAPYPQDEIRYSPGPMIDPNLDGEGSPSTPIAPPNRSFTAINQSQQTQLDSTNNSSQHKFVAPAALMYAPARSNLPDTSLLASYANGLDGSASQHEDGQMFEDGSILDDGSLMDNDYGRIRLTASKKRKRGGDRADGLTEPPVSGATKQFRREQERKQLEEARKNGVFIMTNAVLRGRSKLVKLKIDSSSLRKAATLQNIAQASLQNEAAQSLGRAERASRSPDILLQSDVIPPPTAAAQTPQQSTTKQGAKSSNAIRVRVEADDDFRIRKRSRKPTSKAQSANSTMYEELTIDSDEDEYANQPASQQKGRTQDRRRKIPGYLADRRASDDSSELQELPDDWKDGKAAARDRSRSKGKVNQSGADTKTSADKSDDEYDDEGIMIPVKGVAPRISQPAVQPTPAHRNGSTKPILHVSTKDLHNIEQALSPASTARKPPSALTPQQRKMKIVSSLAKKRVGMLDSPVGSVASPKVPAVGGR